MREEWRAEQQAATRDAHEHWTHRQTLAERLRAHMHRGDTLRVDVAGECVIGNVEEVGDDLLGLRTPVGRIDIHLTPTIPFRFEIVEAARQGGHRGSGAAAGAFRYALMARERDTTVRLGMLAEPAGLEGRLEVGADHVVVTTPHGSTWGVPISSVAWIGSARRRTGETPQSRPVSCALTSQRTRGGPVVLGSRGGLREAAASEVTPRDTVELRRRCDVHRCLRTDFRCARERTAERHADVEQGAHVAVATEAARDEAGMHGVGRDTRAVEPPGELTREEQVHELRASVGAEASVATRRLEVGEVESAARESMRFRRHDHDARRRARLHAVAEQTSEEERAEVVRLELCLVTVLGDAALVQHQARVVHEDVEAVVLVEESLREVTHRPERGQVERSDLGRGARPRSDPVARGGAALRITGGDHDVRTASGESDRRLETDAGVAAGDERDLSVEIRAVQLIHADAG